MSRVALNITMSLDGFVTAPNDGPGRGLGDDGEVLHYWVFGGPWSYDSRPNGEATGVDKQVLVEATQVPIDVFLADKQAVARQSFAQARARRQRIGTEHRAVVAVGRDVLEQNAAGRVVPRLGADHLLLEVRPALQIVAANDVVIDPIRRAWPLIVEHRFPPSPVAAILSPE